MDKERRDDFLVTWDRVSLVDEIARLEAEVAELKRTRKTSEAYLFDAYWNDLQGNSKAEVGHWLVERGLLGE